MSEQHYYFYVLYCADHTLYGGYSTDVRRRFAMHQSGKGAKYTRPKKRHPLKLLYYEEFDNQHDALSAEWHFKHQSRAKKIAYLRAHNIKI
nr:GIY-YIG nuclease family protein [Limosilactobacillus mucosae]